jgi:triacylglycerol lipase
MALGSQYCKQIREELRRHANYPPNKLVELGDFGVLDDHVFERLGNLRQFGVTFNTIDGTGRSSFQFKTKGNVDFHLIAKGDVQAGGITAVRAGLELKFSHEDAVFFVAAECTTKAIDNLLALESALISLLNQGRWQTEFYVVTEINAATKTTAIASADKDCEIKLEASSPAIEAIELGDANLELRVKRSRNTSLEVVTEKGQVPLIQLSRLRGFFHDKLRPEAVAPVLAGRFRLLTEDADTPMDGFEPHGMIESVLTAPTSEPESVQFVQTNLEATQSDFEIGRAINAYIPLLQASYDFAHGNETPSLPVGYEIIAPILSSTEEGPVVLEALSPEDRAAVENDFRAIAEESVRTAEGAVLEAIPRPDAFGFIFREASTNAVIVSVRGTQTPEEWVKNFTAVPFPFVEVPGFGLVHLGFDQMWRRIRNTVLNSLAAMPQGTRITFLGHSLGGAMVDLGAADAKKTLTLSNVDVCTFGGPRAGQVRFRINFDRLVPKCFRVTEMRDIVPHVPPLFLGWNHAGLQIGVRSQIANAHSLESYLEGMQNVGLLGQGQAGSALETARFQSVIATRIP